jgi:hypothetical protein
MGNAVSIKKPANFEDIQRFVFATNSHILLNVMDETDQDVLIFKTLSVCDEVKTLETLIDDAEFDYKILIYGKNMGDIEKILKKQKQLEALGFSEVYVYFGGLFEWVLLQDIYGKELFKTTRSVTDILRYK